MSVMASDAGAFKAATGLFASLDGAWHEVPLGGAAESPFDAVLAKYSWTIRQKYLPSLRVTNNSLAHVPYWSGLQSPTFTVVVGVRSETSTNNMMGRFDATNNAQKCWFLDSAGAGGVARAYVRGSADNVITSTVPIVNGWHLLTITVDASKVFTFYVDGVSAGTPITVAGTIVNATAVTPVFIGDRDGTAGGKFTGSFSDILVGPGVMSAADVAALYAAWDKKGT
jgi:hypothetical protein